MSIFIQFYRIFFSSPSRIVVYGSQKATWSFGIDLGEPTATSDEPPFLFYWWQIDGFEQDKKVVVIAATNRKQDLDPALIR